MKLILLVGPSGSGKDTLLRAARKRFNGSHDLGLVRRYITRPPDGNEDNYYVDNTCFKLLKHSGFFVSDWQAHNNEYGIAHHALANGTAHGKLLCSISRGAITDFEQHYGDVTVLLVTAPMGLLKKRLTGRDRENDKDIEKRLQRATRPVEARKLITFDNSASLEKSQSDFITLLEAI